MPSTPWSSVPGRFGQMYHEGVAREFKVMIDRDKRIGASFVDAAAAKDLVVTSDVVFAKPGVKPLSTTSSRQRARGTCR